MIIEIAVAAMAIAFVVLVAYLVATFSELKKALVEAQRLLIHLNAEMPFLLKDVRTTIGNVTALTDQARDGIDHASVFLHAVGDVGETVQQVHGMVRGGGGNLVSRVATLVAGLRAASAVVKDRFSKGNPNGASSPEV